MTGEDLRDLIRARWGYSFDVQLRRVKGKMYLQIMWKYLEQASFPLSPEEYIAHLDQVVEHLQAWNCGEAVRNFIQTTKEKPRLGKAIGFPIDLGERASEWMMDS